MSIRICLMLVLALVCPAFAQSTTQASAEAKPTLWLIGDSTVKVGTRGQQGWGDPIKEMFDENRIRIENRARGGRSSRTFHTEGLWNKILEESRPGDFVIIQFGHNDGGKLVDERSRGSIRGIGEESEEVTKPDGSKEVVHTYGGYLRRFVREAREKGMTPIICSYIPRSPRPGNEVPADPEPSSYRLWAQQVAEQEKVPYIDLYGLIWQTYVGKTPEEIKAAWFSEADFTHTSAAGAKHNAEAVVRGIRQLTDVPLAGYLKPAAE